LLQILIRSGWLGRIDLLRLLSRGLGGERRFDYVSFLSNGGGRGRVSGRSLSRLFELVRPLDL
jgi:hypothetical protein